MGRQIRRVPPDWEHPRDNRGRLQPLFDRPFEQEAREWMDVAIAWDNGTDKDCAKHKATHPFYWQWAGGPPNPEYYRPAWTTEPTHYQMYENVSEGTPVTPHFATEAELIEHLVQHGEDGENIPWDRDVTRRFVTQGWAPSMVIGGGEILVPRTGGF